MAYDIEMKQSMLMISQVLHSRPIVLEEDSSN